MVNAIVWQTEIAGFAIRLAKHKLRKDTYSVQYGTHITKDVRGSHAAHELGNCIMHALQCEGKLDD